MNENHGTCERHQRPRHTADRCAECVAETYPDNLRAIGDEIGFLPQAVAFAQGRTGSLADGIAFLLALDDEP